MDQLLSKLNSGELIALVAIIGGMAMGAFVIAVHYWHKVRQVELKREMLCRGMSAEEIRIVLEAGEAEFQHHANSHESRS